MPRRLRQLRADLRKAGFIEQRDRGKVSHVRWYHPLAPETTVTLSGHDNDDARAYQELTFAKRSLGYVRHPNRGKRGQ